MDNTKALQPYGTDEQIQQLAQRIKDYLPGGSRLKDHEALTLAQISIVYGLNAFNGEVWYIPAKGPMVGIKGLRKAARKQSGYVLRQHDMDMAEREDRLLQDGDKGSTCDLYRCDLGLAMQQANVPFIGEGIARQNERFPHTKSLRWLANKRAEADALKKAFDLPFGFDELENGASPSTGLPHVELLQPAPPRPEAAGSARAAAAELYGDWDGEVFAAGEDDPPAGPQEQIVEATATVISDEPQPAEQPATTTIVNTQTGEITEQPATQTPFPDRNTAIAWGHEQGVFEDPREAHRHYMKLKARKRPIGGAHMSLLWRQYVAGRLQQLASTPEA